MSLAKKEAGNGKIYSAQNYFAYYRLCRCLHNPYKSDNHISCDFTERYIFPGNWTFVTSGQLIMALYSKRITHRKGGLFCSYKLGVLETFHKNYEKGSFGNAQNLAYIGRLGHSQESLKYFGLSEGPVI